MPDALAWYAVWTRSRHEQVVREQLERKGLEAFLPTITRWSHWKDRKKQVSMFHAALAAWEVKPFCRVLQALVSLNQRIGLGLSVQAVASGRLKEKVLPS